MHIVVYWNNNTCLHCSVHTNSSCLLYPIVQKIPLDFAYKHQDELVPTMTLEAAGKTFQVQVKREYPNVLYIGTGWEEVCLGAPIKEEDLLFLYIPDHSRLNVMMVRGHCRRQKKVKGGNNKKKSEGNNEEKAQGNDEEKAEALRPTNKNLDYATLLRKVHIQGSPTELQSYITSLINTPELKKEKDEYFANLWSLIKEMDSC